MRVLEPKEHFIMQEKITKCERYIRQHVPIPKHYTLKAEHLQTYMVQSFEERGTVDLRSLNTLLSVLSCNIVRLSNNVNIFCGGSRMAKSGLRLGKTVIEN